MALAQVRDGPGLGGAAGVLPGQEARRGRGGREARRLDAAGAHHRVPAAQTRHLRGGPRVTSHATRVMAMCLQLAMSKNSSPLPTPAQKSGLRLPPDRYCLTAANFRSANSFYESNLSNLLMFTAPG